MHAKEHFRQILAPTPFHERLAPLALTREWTRWGGYASPNAYIDAGQEYFQLRTQATLYDLSPMTKYRIEGPDAERYLNYLVTRDVSKQKPGRVLYVVWCNDEGQVLDDGTLFRFSPRHFRLCCAEFHLPWLQDAAEGFNVTVSDETEQVAALSLQGPCSFAVLEALGLTGVEKLKLFDLGSFPFQGGEITVSRTGFTGDLGYEIWCDPAQALPLFDALMAAGKHWNLRPMGSKALNMARIEAGFLMPKIDFLPADLALRRNRGRSPFELGLDWLVDLNKGPFNGRTALLEEKKHGSRYCLVGLELIGNKTQEGALIYFDQKEEVGHLTSAMWSPTTKRNIAIASLRRPYGDTIKDNLWVEVYVLKELKWDKLMTRGLVVPRLFYDPPRKKLTPPPRF